MPPLLQAQLHKLCEAAVSLLSPASILSLPALAASIAIATLYLARRQHRRRGRVRWAALSRALIASRRILRNRSTGADLFYFLINTFAIGGLIGWAVCSGSAVSALTVRVLTHLAGTPAPSHAPAWALRTGITIAAFLGYELGYYIDHYCKHKIPFLWEFHKTHHSAEVLTPLTVFRVHPFDTLIFADIVALCAGLVHGVFTYAAGRPINIYFFGASNIIFVGYFLLLAQLQHSQFWIPFRGAAGRLLVSPAHHQIHHSLNPAYYNCNFGSVLAIFDWLFGTLVIPPETPPRLTFGVAQPGQDPHRIATLLLSPIINACTALAAKRRPPQPALAAPAAISIETAAIS